MQIFWIISQIYLRNGSSKFSLWWSDWSITRMCENTFQKLPCCRLLSRDGDSSWKMHLSWLNHLNMAMTYSEMHSWNSCFGEGHVGIPHIVKPECSSIDLWFFCGLWFAGPGVMNGLGSVWACVDGSWTQTATPFTSLAQPLVTYYSRLKQR